MNLSYHALQSQQMLDPSVENQIYGSLSEISRSIAHDFYERIENKSIETLLKYEQIVKPSKNFFDGLSYLFDKERVGRHAATQHIILERTRPDLFIDRE